MASVAGIERVRAAGVDPIRFLPDPRAARSGVERRLRPREPVQRPIEEELAEEHEVLAAWQDRLARLPRCPDPPDRRKACEHPVAGACREGTLALAEQMLLFMSEHFSREDGVMRRGRSLANRHPQFDLHMEEHGTIIQTLVDALIQPSPCRWREAMRRIVDERFAQHLHTHDEVLRRFLAR